MRHHKRLAPPKGGSAYRQLWRVVNGAVADAFAMHPEYLTDAGRRAARESVVKRVTGAVAGYGSGREAGSSVRVQPGG